MTKIKIILLFSILLSAKAQAQDCKVKEISKGCKPNIAKPYKYDSYAVSEFVFDKKSKQVEVQFTAFQGMKYKIAFCTSGFEEPLQVDIYDKNKNIKNNRHKLYDNSQGIDNNFWLFIPPKSGNYFIDYTIPPSLDGLTKKGCVIMLIGFIGEVEED